MSGRGLAGKGLGLGHGGAKRRCCRRRLDPVYEISRASMRRLTRRAGAKRTSTGAGMGYEMRGALRGYVEDVVRAAIVYTSHGWRKTMTAEDVTRAVRMRTGRVLYAL